MPGSQRLHLRLNAPVQGLEDNIQRGMNSLVMLILNAFQTFVTIQPGL